MDIGLIISFLGAAIVLTLMPGPDNLFVLAQSISNGKNSGIFTSLGLCTGLLVHITASTLGISAIIYQSALAFSIIKYAGAAYLLFLAYKAFSAKKTNLNVENKPLLTYKSLYKKGVIMNILNPKVSLFFLAFLPQFIDQSNENATQQMFVYGVIFLIQTLVIFSLISIFSGKVGIFLRKNPSISKKITYIEGSLFTLIGLKIAFSQK
ncbi:LysE family translocator [Priestia megaterium]|uniref:LysE family translocator n=1 Tax=Priestia TaxID=2800373 RepID=UPI001BE75935|nr:LysE family translocator [Priestia megaterium]MBT2255911.1 LysE family translocator [Priestia megaterium]MDH3161303.1 LysE family translocator [Priestia megaterium]MED4116889.1 LysE family translocator [Priestia megaterium]